MLRYFPLIAKNAMRNRRRSILTICSVGASLCLLGVLMAIYHAFFFTPPTPEQARRLVTRNRISLANVDADRISRQDRENCRCPRRNGSTMVRRSLQRAEEYVCQVRRRARQLFHDHARNQGQPEEQKAFISDRAGCIIGRSIAKKFNLKVGDRMTLVGDIFPVTLDFNIRGIFDFTEADEVMYFNVQYLFESMSARRRDFAGTFHNSHGQSR